jgi:hypothetical protein
MGTILEKIRTLGLGKIHDILDKAIDMDSPSAVRQGVRDVEQALSELENEASIAGGRVRTLSRQVTETQSEIKTKKETITQILAANKPNSETVARERSKEVLVIQARLANLQKDLEQAQTNSAKIDTAVTQLRNKHVILVTRVRELERMDRSSKSKEHAAAALDTAYKLVNSGIDSSIDNVEQRMAERSDVADEKFERSMGNFKQEETPEEKQGVDDLLNSLRPAQEAKAQ